MIFTVKLCQFNFLMHAREDCMNWGKFFNGNYIFSVNFDLQKFNKKIQIFVTVVVEFKIKPKRKQLLRLLDFV